MTAVAIVSLISLVAWLAFVVSGPEVRRLGLPKGAMMAIVWVVIFALIAVIMAQVMVD